MKRGTLYFELNNPEGRSKLAAFKLLAERLISEHLSPDWEFRWSKDRLSVRTLASCSVMANGIIKGRGGFLSFSRTIVERAEEGQRATILHEIAHAVVFDTLTGSERLRGGEMASHGDEWLGFARALGVPEEHLARYVKK